MVRWAICLGNERTADIRQAVRGNTHTYAHQIIVTRRVRTHTSSPAAIKCRLGQRSLCVCVGVCALWCTMLRRNGFNPLTEYAYVCVCPKALCPCCDIIYECHNWGSVNCRFSPLSVAPCVNNEVQGDGADQYAETGAIRWIYSPVTRGLWNHPTVAFSKLLDVTAVLPASICQTCKPVDLLRNLMLLLFWAITWVCSSRRWQVCCSCGRVFI